MAVEQDVKKTNHYDLNTNQEELEEQLFIEKWQGNKDIDDANNMMSKKRVKLWNKNSRTQGSRWEEQNPTRKKDTLSL